MLSNRNVLKTFKHLFNYHNFNLNKNVYRKSSILTSLSSNLKHKPLDNYINKLKQEYETQQITEERKRELQPIIELIKQHKSIKDNLKNLDEMLEDNKNEDIKQLANEEKLQYEQEIEEIENEILEQLIPHEEEDSCDSVHFEINTGVGGQEAMLFAKELFEMYCNFAVYKNWRLEIQEETTTDLGGIRHAIALIEGKSAFRYLKHEAGVHRVQRIPATEKGGRIHTSTCSIVVLPHFTDIRIHIDPKDLKIETKRASGAGGQHVNTTDSAVRITHLPTGLIVDNQTDRSQIKNRQYALDKLKNLMYRKELEERVKLCENKRKSQVKSNYRNEKIRTYNYSQDRITDHRLKDSFHNLSVFLEGGKHLDMMIFKLDANYRLEKLLEIINRLF